jgi:galactose mutarotase-like enzyme
MMEADGVVTLRSGTACAQIAPACGALTLRWSVDGRDWLHCPDDWRDAWPAKVRFGNPVLFPVASHVTHDGRAGWHHSRGQDFRMPQHGFVRELPWRVMERADDRVTCRFVTTPLTRVLWPWEFEAELTLRVEPDALETRLAFRNTSDIAMPWHAGFHPYLALRGEASAYQIDVPEAQRVYLASDPDAECPEPGARRIALDASLARTRFYEGVSERRMVLRGGAGESEVEVTADGPEMGCWAIWREFADSPYVCVEPWSAGVNALHTGRHLQHLAPGARAEVGMRLRVGKRAGSEPGD